MSRNYLWDDWILDLDEAAEALKECDRVFVYGTLQSFGSNHRLMAEGTTLEDGNAVTQAKYVLGDVGYPYAFPSSSVPTNREYLLYPVKGEVYTVHLDEVMHDLDCLEGHPTHYRREIVTLTDGTRAWMYLQYDWKSAAYCNACQLIEGVWKWRA